MKKWMIGLVGVFLALGAAQQMQDHGMMAAGYMEYSQKAFDAAVNQKRVLFFHATWCPNCRAANADINAKLKQIPEGVVIFKTDYDKETALKRKYGITYQHTFVYVDAKGEALKKWSGGGLAEIIANTK